MKKSIIDLTFTVAMVTKMAAKIIDKFLNTFETFDREINIEHKQIPKDILTDDENYHAIQHI